LDTTKKTRRDEEEAVKKFAKAVEKTADNIEEENKERQAATDALEAEIKAREEATRKSKLSREAQEQEDKDRALKKAKDEAAQRNQNTKLNIEQNRRSSSSSRELFDSLSSTGGSAAILRNQFLDLGGDSLTAQSGLQLFSAGLSGTTKSLTTFASGLINGERGAQLSAKALNDFATPILDVASSIGTLLTVLSFIPGPIGFMSRGARMAGAAVFGLGSAAGKAALKFNEIGAKQLDTLVKSFNDASSAGVSLTGGLEGTLDLMHTLNMTTADAAQFQEMLSKNNKQLALLGGTAGVGAKRFAEVSGALVKSDIGQTFEIMGITQQEQREAALLYMSIQARTGQMQLKNTEKLIEESARFVHELDQAAQLTGATRREQQEAREAAMAEVRFRAALIDAQQRGDTADMAQLKVAERAAAIAKSLGDEKGFLGILQQAAGQGALTTPEAIAAEQTYKISEILAQPNITDQQILAHLAKNADLNLQSLAGTNRLIGGIDVLQTNIVGMDNSVKRQNALAQEAAKEGFTGPEAITNYLKQEEKKRKQPGGDMALMVGAGRAQQAAAMTMEQGISTYNIAADINKAASEAFAKAVKEFGEITGVKPVPGGTPTFGGAPVESGVRLQPTVEAASDKVVQINENLKDLGVKIKEQEQKLAEAKTNVEKDKAETEIKKLKSEVSDATKAKNAAELGKQAIENRTRLGEANERLKKPVSIDTKLMESLSTGGIKDKRAQANIMAQVQAESGGVAKSENLNYSPERLMKVFPKKFANIQEASQVAAKGPEAIGERVYGGRMGNTVAGEGFKYRGRGLIQITGKDNYKKFGDMIGVDLVQNPDLANEPEIARKLAVAYFQDKQKSGVDLTKSRQVSQAVGHVDIGGSESMMREAIAQKILEQMPKARDGGTFSGPTSGYPVMLHGKEAVVPLNKSQDGSKAMGDQSVQRESLSQKILGQIPKARDEDIFQSSIQKILGQIPNTRDGGTLQSPMSGYPAVQPGKEAVIPLKNGSVPVMMPALNELVSSSRAVDAQVQVLRNEMGSMMRELVNAIETMKETGSQERIIQLLESMSRSQQTTATASQRMAQLASN
jgi:predicted chitinase